MFDKPLFPFDAEKFMEMFRSMDVTKVMADLRIPSVKPEELMAAQKKNMDAFVEANRAAAAGYQDLFRKQVAIFEETMAEARAQLARFDASRLTPEGAAAQAEIAKAAFEKAIANMKALAEAAQKANQQAFEIVSARVKDSIEELRAMAAKYRA